MSGAEAGPGTAALSDALDRLGVEAQAHGIRPLHPGARIFGPAFTVRLGPAGGRGGTVGDFIDEVPEGSVVVLDNGGRTDVSVWGELLTTAAIRGGVAGTVVHGVCRDSDRIGALGYAMFSRGAFMRTGKDRVRAEEIGAVVSLGGASAAPGDLVAGDADGVVVVPGAIAERVVVLAREIDAVENAIRARVEAGEALADARRAEGYHGLQRRETP